MELTIGQGTKVKRFSLYASKSFPIDTPRHVT
jgi:hypothetical protein